jgi:hypothetical protein
MRRRSDGPVLVIWHGETACDRSGIVLRSLAKAAVGPADPAWPTAGGQPSVGLAAGGATIDDFRHPDGVQGAFQNEFLIHLRAGEPCVQCGSTVVKMIAATRDLRVPDLPAAPARAAAPSARRRPAEAEERAQLLRVELGLLERREVPAARARSRARRSPCARATSAAGRRCRRGRARSRTAPRPGGAMSAE